MPVQQSSRGVTVIPLRSRSRGNALDGERPPMRWLKETKEAPTRTRTSHECKCGIAFKPRGGSATELPEYSTARSNVRDTGKGNRWYGSGLARGAKCAEPNLEAPRSERAGYLETRTSGSEGRGRIWTGLDATRRSFWRVEATNSTSPASYPTSNR
jgi:hypothetical protein